MTPTNSKPKLPPAKPSTVRVAVRIRPQLGKEKGNELIASVQDSTIVLSDDINEVRSSYHAAFGAESTQANVYEFVR
jgi:hypothetical protein